MVESIYSQLGEEGLKALVAAFYQRVRTDEVIGPLYPPDDWENAERRLADFLIYRFGGSDRYIQERGHPRLRGRHMPFSIGVKERDRWMELMRAAMTETKVPEGVAAVMDEFFAQVADMMRNRED
ncbi:MAG: globin [Verrucomicrobiaceae bacterium]